MSLGSRSVLIVILLGFVAGAHAQTTEFTYQGSLQNSSAPANGNFDFEFLLYDALSGGTQAGATLTKSGVSVANGVFSVKLDFGANYPGANRFLEIRIRTSGGGAFTTLSPRQAVSNTPYAVKSLSADTAVSAATAVTAGNVSGVVSVANGGTGSSTQSFVDLTTNQTVNGNKTFAALSVFNGTVGIGTSSPQRALSVVGGLEVDQGNQNGSDVNTFGINFGTGSGSGIASNRSGVGANPNGLNFYASDSGSPKMALTAAGQLGIGTSNPFAMLHVNGTGFFSDTVTSGSFIGSGTSLTGLNASNLASGTLPAGRLTGTYTGALTFNNVANAFTGTFTGSGAGLTGLSASSFTSGTLPDGRLSGTYSSPLTLSNAGNAFTGSGAGLTGLNASNLATGTIADSRLSANVGLLTGTQTFSGAKTFTSTTVFTGNVGIGTSPGAKLDVQVAAGQSLQFRQDSGLVPGINVNTSGGNAGIMRLRNSIEVWPSDDSTRAGRMDIRNTAGNPTISLDGQSGNLTANNLPGVEFDVPANPFDHGVIFDVGTGQTATVKTVTVSVPTSGFLVYSGSVLAWAITPGGNTTAQLQIFDETSNATIAESTFLGSVVGYSTIAIQGVLPVSAGSRTLSLKLKASTVGSEHAAYWSNTGSLTVMFFPVRY